MQNNKKDKDSQQVDPEQEEEDKYQQDDQDFTDQKKQTQQLAIQSQNQQLKIQHIIQLRNPISLHANLAKQLSKPRQFWDTQPVPKLAEMSNTKQGPLEAGNLEMVKKDSYTLPENFEWCEVDITNEDQAQQIYTLLSENYVEDDDNMFRFDYSIEFLKWAILPPGFYPDWIIGVRVKKSKKLVGFITGIPVHLSMEGEQHTVKMTEINFLCVHKKLRANRLAPVLIKEITRRVHVRNMWQAVYTAGVVIPTPISQTRYFHRSLNPKKLIEVGFSSLGPKQTISRQQKLYRLPDETKTPGTFESFYKINSGLRQMKKKDVSQVFKLLRNYLTGFKLYFKYSEDEIRHWLIPRKDVIYSYVVETQDEQKQSVITDFVSFYCLPSSIINNAKYNKLRAAYSYYNVSTKTPIVQLMHDALILAKNENFDVFNALDIMDNEVFLKVQIFPYVKKLQELMFSPGDGSLNYYLYNWKLQAQVLAPKDIGIVLV